MFPAAAPHPLARATALFAALCVLMLAIFAASPGLHAHLHAHGTVAAQADGGTAGETGHTCAVTLFAQGVTALLVFCLLILARAPRAVLWLGAADLFAIAQSRYRHVPSHAPPSA